MTIPDDSRDILPSSLPTRWAAVERAPGGELYAARKPAPEIAQIAYFEGMWTCEGKTFETPMGPAGAMKGRAVRDAVGRQHGRPGAVDVKRLERDTFTKNGPTAMKHTWEVPVDGKWMPAGEETRRKT
jgi:hypothetical protein